MIRFSDQRMDCMEYGSLRDREELLHYFQKGHESDVICIYDSFNTMKFIGIISLYSLERVEDVKCAIMKEHVVFDKNIWLNARSFFSNYEFWFQEHVLLPILNKKGQLVCFAYEDGEANREIRMLRELVEMQDTLQFVDIYPEYKCVKIYGFNELAYFFAVYLKNIGVVVEVIGKMWHIFFDETQCQGSGYECLEIYAEGGWSRKNNWTENLLRSVSVEFEYIDKIYEANIKEQRIKDAQGSIEDLLMRLRNEKEIIIYGTGCEEQDAFNYLLEQGIDVCCFVGLDHTARSHRIFGKNVISGLEARSVYKNAIFIDCISQNSAWGMGKVDYYDYIEYRRNKRFILLRDYIEVKRNSLLSVLKRASVVLLGDIGLCSRLTQYLYERQISVKGYLDIPFIESNQRQLPRINIDAIKEEDVCLIVTQEIFGPEVLRNREEVEIKWGLITYLEENKLNNYTDYFSYLKSFVKIEGSISNKYNGLQLKPKRIVIGSIESRSGQVFLRGLLDNHPSIMMLHYSNLNDDLLWICIRLSMESAENIPYLFEKMYKGDKTKPLDNPEAFIYKMKCLLNGKDRYTSQELFVIIHIAYMYMYGKDIMNVNDMIIYWAPHFVECEVLEECVEWLGEETVPCDIINMVRNRCMSSGSWFKCMTSVKWYVDKKWICYNMLKYPSINKKKFKGSYRLVIRFEDLKRNPQQNLANICEKWDIVWADTLMYTTCKGEKHSVYNQGQVVCDFDLDPVYNTYETYFSEFDRFRIMLISAPWQQKYGYPYVEISLFSGRELQDMFSKKFRFEHEIVFNNSKEEFEYNLQMSKIVSTQLRLIKLQEHMQSMR